MADLDTARIRPPGTTTVAPGRATAGPGSAPPQDDTETNELSDALVEEIRRRYGSDIPFLFPRIEDLIRGRLELAPVGVGGAAVAGLAGIGIRLGLALLATLLVGGWAEIPWPRWVPILVFYGVMDATQPLRTPPLDTPPGPRARQIVDDMMALLPNVAHLSDLHDLAEFARRRYRLSWTAIAGVLVTALILFGTWWLAPKALSELHPGSVVLLALVLYDFGANIIGTSFFDLPFMAREARYDHRLFWPSPVDTPEVQKAIRTITLMGFVTGVWITIYLILALILAGWDAPFLVPISAGFVLLGYLTVFVLTLSVRASIQRIVQRARDRELCGLRRRIAFFESRYPELSPDEAGQLLYLIDLHDRIRDAPTTPTTTHTAAHTAVGLILPTIMFVVTVFGEVSAERLLDTFLP